MPAEEWIFSGIGTEALSGIVGLVFGGVVGYRIGIKSANKQIQKAGDGATQTQSYTVETCPSSAKGKSDIESHNIQKQKAGNNATQVQTGKVYHGN